MTDLTDLDSPQPESPFERIRQIDPDDYEFWSARDLMLILEYTKWQNYKTVLIKAQLACENSGNDPSDHFTDASKMVVIGSDAKCEIADADTLSEGYGAANEAVPYHQLHNHNHIFRLLSQHPGFETRTIPAQSRWLKNQVAQPTAAAVLRSREWCSVHRKTATIA